MILFTSQTAITAKSAITEENNLFKQAFGMGHVNGVDQVMFIDTGSSFHIVNIDTARWLRLTINETKESLAAFGGGTHQATWAG